MANINLPVWTFWDTLRDLCNGPKVIQCPPIESINLRGPTSRFCQPKRGSASRDNIYGSSGTCVVSYLGCWVSVSVTECEYALNPQYQYVLPHHFEPQNMLVGFWFHCMIINFLQKNAPSCKFDTVSSVIGQRSMSKLSARTCPPALTPPAF